MKLGTYTFEFRPEQFTPPRVKVAHSVVETLTSVATFSWGPKIVGQRILCEWKYMTCDQFNRIDAIFAANAVVVWNPEIIKKLFHGAVTNGPFMAGKTITGTGAATGTVGTVWSGENYIEVTPLTGTFLVGDTITDNSSPAKVAIVTSFENVGTFNVKVLDFDGKYVEEAGPDVAAMRQDVILELLILSLV